MLCRQEDVSETFEDKLIRIIFIKLLQKLFGSRQMCDLIRKIQGLKFARKTRCDSYLKFKVELQFKLSGETIKSSKLRKFHNR